MKNKDYETIADGIVAIKKEIPRTQKAKHRLINEIIGSIEFEIEISSKKPAGEFKLFNLVYEKMKERK